MRQLFIILISSTLIGFLGAMELPKASQKEQKLFVINSFPLPIRVIYYLNYEETEPQHLDVTSGGTKELPGFRNVKKLHIVPYGKWLQYASRKIIGLQPPDYNFTIQKEAAEYPQEEKLALEISPKAQGIAGQFLVYNVKVAPFEEAKKFAESLIPLDRRLTDALPRVKIAQENKQPILARYVLGVGEGANREDIDREYNQFLSAWGPATKGDDAEYAKDLLKVAKMAYIELKAELDLDELIAIIKKQEKYRQQEFEDFIKYNVHVNKIYRV